jgi:hypothetical protein
MLFANRLAGFRRFLDAVERGEVLAILFLTLLIVATVVSLVAVLCTTTI